jgi:hypothetical protein
VSLETEIYEIDFYLVKLSVAICFGERLSASRILVDHAEIECSGSVARVIPETPGGVAVKLMLLLL